MPTCAGIFCCWILGCTSRELHLLYSPTCWPVTCLTCVTSKHWVDTALAGPLLLDCRAPLEFQPLLEMCTSRSLLPSTRKNCCLRLNAARQGCSLSMRLMTCRCKGDYMFSMDGLGVTLPISTSVYHLDLQLDDFSYSKSASITTTAVNIYTDYW